MTLKADLWSFPIIRSPSQWPGTVRAFTPSWRSSISVMFASFPGFSAPFVLRFLPFWRSSWSASFFQLSLHRKMKVVLDCLLAHRYYCTIICAFLQEIRNLVGRTVDRRMVTVDNYFFSHPCCLSCCRFPLLYPNTLCVRSYLVLFITWTPCHSRCSLLLSYF